ncbi:MAG: agmatinase [Nanoarchaeota archaeon]
MEYVKSHGNFGDLPDNYSSYGKSKTAILPFPYEKTTSYGKGTEKGPSAIIEASHEMELYDDEIGAVYECGICTLKDLKTNEDANKMADVAYSHAKKILSDNKFLVTLGGEHSITSGIVKAYSEKYPKLSVLQIDAHADLREEFEDSKHSHACAMKRSFEFANVVQVGIRSLSEEEADYVKEKNLKIFWARDIVDNDKWFDEAISRLSNDVYITFDVDGLDPSIMPSTGTPEPGGLSYYQTMRFLKKVFEKKNVVGCDLVELAPIKNLHAPDFMCSRIVYKMIGYKFKKL